MDHLVPQKVGKVQNSGSAYDSLQPLCFPWPARSLGARVLHQFPNHPPSSQAQSPEKWMNSRFRRSLQDRRHERELQEATVLTSTIRCNATTLNSICQLNLNTLKSRPDSVEGLSTNYKSFVHKSSTLSRHTEQHHLLFSLPARDVCRGVYCHALRAANFGQWTAKGGERVASVARTRPDAKVARLWPTTRNNVQPPTNEVSSTQPMFDHTRSML